MKGSSGIPVVLCVLAVLTLATAPTTADQASDVKALVEKGVAVALGEGVEDTLKLISNPKGPFINGELYLFAGPLDKVGISAHPYNPELLDRDLSVSQDSRGNFLFADFMKIALTDGAGWTTYWWPKPGKEAPSPKRSYIMKVPGENLYIGCGFYTERPRRESPKEKMTEKATVVKALVEKGIAVALTEGVEDTLKLISDPKGPFIDGELYLFAGLLDKVEITAHPYNPELFDRDLSASRDSRGNFLFIDLLQLALTDGAGWTTYWWPKPGKEAPSPKRSYIMKVPGEDLYIGCGFYTN